MDVPTLPDPHLNCSTHRRVPPRVHSVYSLHPADQTARLLATLALTRLVRCLAIGVTFGLLSIARLSLAAEADQPTSAAVETALPWPAEYLDDADLSAVHFVDEQQGWAVGSRGTIWHTRDGGQRWQRQAGPADVWWRDVFFLDADQGWLAGTRVAPLSTQVTGVLWRTTDGGKTWQAVDRGLLPGLHRIQFTDPRHGWFVGLTSPLYPTGLAYSEDSGQGWQSVTGDTPLALHDLSARPDGSVLVVGDEGFLGQVSQRTLRAQRPRSAERLRALLADTDFSWAVGEQNRGWIRQRTPDSPLPLQNWHPLAPTAEATIQFDWLSGSRAGDTCWLTGRPGSILQRIAPSAQGSSPTAIPQSSGQTGSLRDIQFISPTTGWAVGDQGLIVRTDDGGVTWQRQRGLDGPVAMLVCVPTPSEIPWELLAWQTTNHGYRTRIVLGQALERRRSSELNVRTNIGLQLLGTGNADLWERIEMPQSGVTLTPSELLTRPRSAESSHAASWESTPTVWALIIRQWRPTTIYLPPSDPSGEHEFFRQTVSSALALAADPNFLPELTAEWGLPPWEVAGLISPLPGPPTDASAVRPLVVRHSQLAYPIGVSIGQLVQRGAGSVDPEYLPLQDAGYYQLFLNPGRQAGTVEAAYPSLARWGATPSPPQDILARFALHRDTPQRRPVSAPLGSLSTATDVARRVNQVQQLLRHTQQDTVALQRLAQLTYGMSAEQAAPLLTTLAQYQIRSGHASLARHTLSELLSRFPQSTYCEWGLRTQIAWTVSDEFQAWQAKQQSPANPVVPAQALQNSSWDNTAQAFATEHQQIVPKGDLTAERPVSREKQVQRTLFQLQQLNPSLALAPELRTALAAAHRHSQDERTALLEYRKLMTQTTDIAWKDAAQCEILLAQGRNTGFTKPLVRLAANATRPHLDGQITEELWTSGLALKLTSPEDETRRPDTQVWLNSDAEYFYIAVKCPTSGALPPSVAQPHEDSATTRVRDHSLAHEDRLCIAFDINRDYLSAWELEIGRSGAVIDRLFEDTSWNPQWYVAHHDAGDTWSCELAIPWSELIFTPSAETSAAGESANRQGRFTAAGVVEVNAGAVANSQRAAIWNLSLRRIIPGTGLQSWAHPAHTRLGPGSMGYLVLPD